MHLALRKFLQLLLRGTVVSVALILMIFIFAAAWRAVELPLEEQHAQEYHEELEKTKAHVLARLGESNESVSFHRHIELLKLYANQKAVAPQKDARNWDWRGSVYFSFSTVTTIGYGTFAPSTVAGQALVIVLGGTGILMFGLGAGAISSSLTDVVSALGECLAKNRSERWQLALETLLVVIAYFSLWILSATMFLFLWVEADDGSTPETPWQSLYFTFVTFSTIGYGDYTPNFYLWDIIPYYLVTFSGLVLFAQTVAIGSKLYRHLFGTVLEQAQKAGEHMDDRMDSANKSVRSMVRNLTRRATGDFSSQRTLSRSMTWSGAEPETSDRDDSEGASPGVSCEVEGGTRGGPPGSDESWRPDAMPSKQGTASTMEQGQLVREEDVSVILEDSVE